MTIQTDLQNAVTLIQKDSQLLHSIVHGNDVAEVPTENGTVKTVSKVLKDLEQKLQQDLSGAGDQLVKTLAEARKLSDDIQKHTQDLQTLINALHFPTQLTGHKGKLLGVSQDETGYETLDSKEVFANHMNWRGVFDPKVNYACNDVVSHKGSSFIALQDGMGITPTVGTHSVGAPSVGYWDVLAAGTDQLTQEGDLLIHDGKTSVRLPRGENAQILQMVDKRPVWQDQSLDPSRRVWKLAKGSPLSGWHTRVYLMGDGTINACGHGGNYSNGNPAGKDVYVPSRIITEDPEGRDPEVRFVEVFSGSMQHYGLTAEGDVWSWGHNNFGQLGHGDTNNRAVAKRIEFFVKNKIQVARVITPRHNYHPQACAYFLTKEGRVYACGTNTEGNLGNGTSVNQLTPVQCGALTNIVEVSVCGGPHAVYALQDDGSLWVWGDNRWGQLGLGDTIKRETPLRHPSFENASLKAVKKAVIACGYAPDGNNPAGYGIVLQADGTILTTGWNGEGQLGVGDTTERHHFTPLKVPEGEIFVDIFCGDGQHGSGGAITKQGELYLWGYNGYGQLGTGNTERQLTPFKPNAPFQRSVTRSVFGGGCSYEGCIVQAGNALWAAGYSETGATGIGTFNKTNATFQRVLGQSGTIEDWNVFGKGTNQWGLCVLYTDGRVDACGESSVYGETGTQTANIHNVAALTNVIFV